MVDLKRSPGESPALRQSGENAHLGFTTDNSAAVLDETLKTKFFQLQHLGECKSAQFYHFIRFNVFVFYRK